MKNRTYTEMSTLDSYDERLRYLRIHSKVAEDTFGSKRYINQKFYKSPEWKSVRNQVIERDRGCDLGIPDRPISGNIYVHHINPINQNDLLSNNFSKLTDLDNLVCVSERTHNMIHYSNNDSIRANAIVERSPNDTCPWKK